MNSKPTRPPYRGTERSIVISIDVGTTFSGTSWALLEPFQTPEIWDVSGFEGQEFQPSATKVPTVIYYDLSGKLRAIGSETLDPEITFQARTESWIKVEWFKLLLRPDRNSTELEGAPKTELPPGRTVVQVLGDYLEYMAGLARKHFLKSKIGAGRTNSIWEEVKGRAQYVLSHPNGWNTFQHDAMRTAAIKGSLIPDTDAGKSRIHFVSEGEASLHWCMSIGMASKVFGANSNIVVVDAGGGTIDVSSFNVTATSPLQLKEISSPDCYLSGSVFVTIAFKNFVEEKLGAGSMYGDKDTIECLVDDFDKRTKCTFRSKDKKAAVVFGSPRENEKEFDIMSGRLVVQGHEMVEFFKKSCDAVERGIRAHVSPRTRTTVFFVGGFSGSPWLFSELERRVRNLNIDLMRADSSTAKAAANGAVSFFLDHFVSARVAKHTYGVSCARSYDGSDPAHVKRLEDIEVDEASGEKFVSGGFTSHIQKGTVVHESEMTRVSFIENFSTRRSTDFSIRLICYKGDVKNIRWFDEDNRGLFQTSCYIHADINESCLTQRRKLTANRFGQASAFPQFYWQANFDIVVCFGTTEFKCYIEWTNEQGKLQKGPVSLVWNEG